MLSAGKEIPAAERRLIDLVGASFRRKPMATTLEELEQRLAALEQEVNRLRDWAKPPLDETAAQQGARMLRESQAHRDVFVAGWDKFMEHLGLLGLQPVGPEKLQEMMLADGINPEDNSFSREIIAMREE
jgi:hypothetical protein